MPRETDDSSQGAAAGRKRTHLSAQTLLPIRRHRGVCRLSELNEFLAGNTTVELLRTAAFSDTAQIDGGEAEALDKAHDSEPSRRIIARDEQHTTAAEHRRIGSEGGGLKRIEGLDHARTWNGVSNDLRGQ